MPILPRSLEMVGGSQPQQSNRKSGKQSIADQKRSVRRRVKIETDFRSLDRMSTKEIKKKFPILHAKATKGKLSRTYSLVEFNYRFIRDLILRQ